MTFLFTVIILMALSLIILLLPRGQRSQSVPATLVARGGSHPEKGGGCSSSQAADVGSSSVVHKWAVERNSRYGGRAIEIPHFFGLEVM